MGVDSEIADARRGGDAVSLEANKNLIRRYIQAIDENQTGDWSILDEYIAEDFVAHILCIPASASTVRE